MAWVTAGYPEGVPGPDRVPLLALLRRRLTDGEVRTIARELMAAAEFDDADIGALIMQITDELPGQQDVEQVRDGLAAYEWPLED